MAMTSFSIQKERHGFSKSTEGNFTFKPRPSMSANTPEDSVLKVGLVDDVMTIINPEGVYVCCDVG